MGKRSNGEGSIFRNKKTGKWVAQVSYYENGDRKRKTKTSEKRSDANTNLRKLHEEIKGGLTGSADETVEAYLNTWLKSVERDSEENTYRSCKAITEKHTIPHIGKKKLKKLTPIDVQNLIDKLRDNGVGSRSVQLVYAYLNMAMVRACNFDVIRANPCGPVKKPKHEYEKADPFTVDEVRVILKHLKNHHFYSITYTALTTGMRPGELTGLIWPNVDFDKSQIHVVQQLTCPGGIKVIKKPKTKSSIRTIDISESTVNALLEHRKALVRRGLASTEFVFCSKSGVSMAHSTYQKTWAAVLKEVGIRHRGFHHMRHTFATFAISNGVPITVVSATLGHANTSMTLDIYAHVMESQRSDATDTVSRFIG